MTGNWIQTDECCFFSCPLKLGRVGEADVAPTKSAADEMAEKAKEQLAKLAKEMGIPTWALYCIGVGKRSHFIYSMLLKAFSIDKMRRISVLVNLK